MSELSQEVYRLIITRTGEDVLVQRDCAGWKLPETCIPRNCRPAAALTDTLKRELGLTGLCLGNDGLNWAQRAVHYEVLEARDLAWEAPEGLTWLGSTGSIRDSLPGELSAVVEQALAGLSSTGPFGQLGWLDVLKVKLALEIGTRKCTGEFRQLNSSEHFALIRLETNENAVWFKATGKPNSRERAITLWLAKHFPDALPSIVADLPEWNGWVSEEVGSSLRDHMRLERWQAAVALVAEVQVGCIGKTEELLAVGAADHRLNRLIADVDEFFDAVEELMSLQSKSPPEVLGRSELWETADAVKSACNHLAGLGVPDSLMHGDVNPGNVFVSNERCVIGDWCETYIGFPFLTFEHMLAHLQANRPGSEAWHGPLRRVYLKVWASVLSEAQMEQIFPALPLVAVFTHAVRQGSWRDHELRMRPGPARRYRSLARRMWREVRNNWQAQVA